MIAPLLIDWVRIIDEGVVPVCLLCVALCALCMAVIVAPPNVDDTVETNSDGSSRTRRPLLRLDELSDGEEP